MIQDIKDVISVLSTLLLVVVLSITYTGRRWNHRPEAPLILLYSMFRLVGLVMLIGRLSDAPPDVLQFLQELLFPSQVFGNIVLALVFLNGHFYTVLTKLSEGIRQLWLRLVYRK